MSHRNTPFSEIPVQLSPRYRHNLRMPREEEDTFMPYEEEDTFMPYEDDTSPSYLRNHLRM
jgi:hypothetical protein